MLNTINMQKINKLNEAIKALDCEVENYQKLNASKQASKQKIKSSQIKTSSIEYKINVNISELIFK